MLKLTNPYKSRQKTSCTITKNGNNDESGTGWEAFFGENNFRKKV